MARPTEYTQELADRVCAELARCGSLRRVCRKNEWAPWDDTVRLWVAQREDFALAYAHAKAVGIDSLVEEALDIADDGTNDFKEMPSRDGEGTYEKLDVDHVSRSKLRVGYRQWLAERMAPKKYGVKQDITSGGEPLKPADTAPVFNVTLNTTESPGKG
jgi:hypothetical protein